jgi:thiol-disulfide isomerase/thioredoxin
VTHTGSPSPLDTSLPLPEGEAKDAPSDSHGATWPLAILLLLAAATLLTIQLRRPKPAPPLVGQPLPPLDAAGWINTDRPLTAPDLRGKVVVIDFWASWCSECALDLPKLVKFREKYRGEGVELVGLSPESPAYLDQIQQFVHRVDGVDWPIGYGAWMAYQVTGIEAFPTYVLYDRNSVSVWSGATIDELENAVVELLAKK